MLTKAALTHSAPEKAKNETLYFVYDLFEYPNSYNFHNLLIFAELERRRLRMDRGGGVGRLAQGPRELVESAVSIIGPQAAERGNALTFHVAPGVPARALGDEARLRQVLLNLVGNAIKFTEAGEILIGIERRTVDGADALVFSVRDTGIGIDNTVQERLFKAFSQTDVSITRRFGGTGLGLSITKNLVQMMGGTIWVESTPGTGSTFAFTAWLGVAEDKPDARRVLPQALNRMRALVVDDNQAAREILSDMLAGAGLRVVAVATGAEAIAAHPQDKLAERVGGLVPDVDPGHVDLGQPHDLGLFEIDLGHPKRLAGEVESGVSQPRQRKDLPAPALEFKVWTYESWCGVHARIRERWAS